MTRVSKEPLTVLPYWDEKYVLVSIPFGVPFSAASITETLRVLRPFSARTPSLSWHRAAGLCFTLPIVSRGWFERLMFDVNTLPLEVERPREDQSLPEVLFIDRTESGDAVAVLDPSRTVTTYQVNSLINIWAERNRNLNPGDSWSLDVENGCLVISNPVADVSDLYAAVRPRFLATGHATVRIYHDSNNERTAESMVTVAVRATCPGFRPDIDGVSERSNFVNIGMANSRSIMASYLGTSVYWGDPLGLLNELNPVVVHFMRELGVHPSLNGKLKVVFDQTHRSPEGSRDYDLEIAQRFPIRPLY